MFDSMYNALDEMLVTKYGYHSDKNEWYAIGKENIGHHITAGNVFTLRVECFVWMIDNRFLAVIKDVAETMHAALEPERELVTPPEMLTRQLGKDFGMQDYVD
jgi:hypothetical protein